MRLNYGPDLQIILWIISKKKYKIKIAEIPRKICNLFFEKNIS
jgi:hypothetical protein